MATLDVCFDNRLGGARLSARQIASLAGQRAKATESHNGFSLFGEVGIVSAGAWDDARVDMILQGEEPVIARFRQDDVDRPQVSIGYTRVGDNPDLVMLREVALLGHPRTIEKPEVPTNEPITSVHNLTPEQYAGVLHADAGTLGAVAYVPDECSTCARARALWTATRG